jgi:hypothetical protein
MIQEKTRVRLKNDPSVIGVALAQTKDIAGKLYQRIRIADGSER